MTNTSNETPITWEKIKHALICANYVLRSVSLTVVLILAVGISYNLYQASKNAVVASKNAVVASEKAIEAAEEMKLTVADVKTRVADAFLTEEGKAGEKGSKNAAEKTLTVIGKILKGALF